MKINPTLWCNYVVLNLAVGCSNLIPPEDAWIKREDDKIIIGCYMSRQTWQLRCHDGRWTGVVSNCSQDASRGYYTSTRSIGNICCPCFNNRTNISVSIIRLHRSNTYIDAAFCYRPSSVGLSVGLSVTLVSPAKTAEPIELPIGMRTLVGPGNHVLDVGPVLPNEGALCGGRASHCKVYIG